MKYNRINISLFFMLVCSTLFATWFYISSDKYIHIKEEKNIPRRYAFLLFPSKNTVIYESELLRKKISEKSVIRAITASFAEIKKSTIKVIIDINSGSYGYLKSSSLQFLPPDNTIEYLNGWKKYLKFQGYTDGRWSVNKVANGNKLVELELIDSKHARSDIFRYETDGKSIVKVYQANCRSGISTFIGTILVTLALIIIFLFWLILPCSCIKK